MTTVKIYRNKRNEHKFLEVHNDGHFHNYVRQFMKWGNDVKNLHTTYDSLTPAKMVEYIEVNKQVFVMERAKKQQKQVKYKWKFVRKFLYKLEYLFRTIRIN